MLIHQSLTFTEISAYTILFLAQQALYATILALLIFPLTRVLKKRALTWQMGLWLLVMLRLVLPPSISGAWSARQLAELAYRAVFQGGSLQGQSIWEIYAMPESQSPRLPAAALETLQCDWQMALCGLWATGALATAFHFFRQHRRYRLVLERAEPIQNIALNELLQRYRRRFGIRRQIRLATADVGLSPCTSGILRPVIFLPFRMLQRNDPTTLRAILAHEVVHVAQYDNVWLLAQNLLQIVYWFHPVVWLITRQMTILRECRCDQLVVARCRISARTYSHSLLTVVEQLVTPTGATLLSTFCGSRPYRALKLRLLRLSALQDHFTGEHRMVRSQQFWIACVIFVFGTFVLPMAPGVGQETASRGFVAPLHTGVISAPFGPMIHPITKQERFHQGLDIAVPIGTEMYAVADGVVLDVSTTDDDYGQNLILQHADGVTSRYAKLSDILVTKGQIVKAGDRIALSGNTGVSTGPHLHFELQHNGEYQDPSEWIDFTAFETAPVQ